MAGQVGHARIDLRLPSIRAMARSSVRPMIERVRGRSGTVEAESEEGSGHDLVDQAAAVDERAVAIEKHELHSVNWHPLFSSKPSRFQLCTMCGGNRAVTRSRPPADGNGRCGGHADAASSGCRPKFPVDVGLEIFSDPR